MAEFRHIIRIVNTDLEGNRKILDALRKIRGVSFMYANMACGFAKVDRSKKAGELTDAEAEKLTDTITNPLKYGAPRWMLNRRNDYESGEDKHLLTGDIKFIADNDIKRLKMIKARRGIRHMFGLPVRGQRTKSNFRKNKGKVLGVKRAKSDGKT